VISTRTIDIEQLMFYSRQTIRAIFYFFCCSKLQDRIVCFIFEMRSIMRTRQEKISCGSGSLCVVAKYYN